MDRAPRPRAGHRGGRRRRRRRRGEPGRRNAASGQLPPARRRLRGARARVLGSDQRPRGGREPLGRRRRGVRPAGGRGLRREGHGARPPAAAGPGRGVIDRRGRAPRGRLHGLVQPRHGRRPALRSDPAGARWQRRDRHACDPGGQGAGGDGHRHRRTYGPATDLPRPRRRRGPRLPRRPAVGGRARHGRPRRRRHPGQHGGLDPRREPPHDPPRSPGRRLRRQGRDRGRCARRSVAARRGGPRDADRAGAHPGVGGVAGARGDGRRRRRREAAARRAGRGRGARDD